MTISDGIKNVLSGLWFYSSAPNEDEFVEFINDHMFCTIMEDRRKEALQ